MGHGTSRSRTFVTRPLVVVRAELNGEPVNVRCGSGRILEVGAAVRPASTDDVIDARGGAVIPGLHDHHLHLAALAARAESVVVGPPEVTTRAQLAQALRQASELPFGGDALAWIRGVGYHESVAGDLDRHDLDEIVADRPVRLQHRSGAMWILNSRALAAAAIGSDAPAGVERDRAGMPTGRLLRVDDWLRSRVQARPVDLRAASERLLAFGVTGVTDATPSTDATDVQLLSDAVVSGGIRQRVTVMGAQPLLGHTWRGIDVGPMKILIDDVALPSVDHVAGSIAAAHSSGRAVAIHCVTRIGLVIAIAAWRQAGVEPGDRIEHASVVPADVIGELRETGILVVTQPSFVHERGDRYLVEVEPDDRDLLYRCGSLIAAGVRVAGSTDAPFGDPNPWNAMAAATDRLTAAGESLGAAERIGPQRALDLFLSPPSSPGGTSRQVRPGAAADLCILGQPLAQAFDALREVSIAATVIAGEIVYRGAGL
jgi:predicted amidohydrolase YtcJ